MNQSTNSTGTADSKQLGRVFVGGLLQESNTFSPRQSERSDYFVATGQSMLSNIAATPVFEEAGIELVPSLFAYSVPGGPLKEADFRSFADEILGALERALDVAPLDGVWLYLHGALEVVEVGSGEAALVTAIRTRVGPEVPIAVAMDFHANNTRELVAAANIICGYRTAPHIDAHETQARAAELLVQAIREGFLPRCIMVSLPMLIPGEMATTPVEPLRSVMPEIARADTIPGILWASFFDGMAWVDAPNSRASVVIVEHPDAADGVARAEAMRLARLIWDRRDEFHFEEETAEPEEAIRRAVAAEKGPVFIADSGDNFTAGAPGDSIWFLRMLIARELPPTLVAGVTCGRAVRSASDLEVGAVGTFDLGGELDPNGERMTIQAVLLWQDRVLDKSGAPNTRAIRISPIENRSVEVIVTENRVSFTSTAGIESAGVEIADYGIVVVKIGYLFDDLRRVAARSIMAFTPGSACQLPERFVYRRVQRPLFPVDREFPDDAIDGDWSEQL